jgi:hypothetical protein
MTTSSLAPQVVLYAGARNGWWDETESKVPRQRALRSSHATCDEPAQREGGTVGGPTGRSRRANDAAPGRGSCVSRIHLRVAVDATTASYPSDETESKQIAVRGGMAATRARHNAATTAAKEPGEEARTQVTQGYVGQ